MFFRAGLGTRLRAIDDSQNRSYIRGSTPRLSRLRSSLLSSLLFFWRTHYLVIAHTRPYKGDEPCEPYCQYCSYCAWSPHYSSPVMRSTASPGEHNLHTDQTTHLITTQMPPITTPQLSLEESQPSSNIPLLTSNAPQIKPGTSQVQEDVNIGRRKQFDAFLSYSSKDRTWANHLKEALHKQGLKVWLDHDQIRPGELFANALERGLEESKAVALIVSPESMESGWVEEEYRRALSLTQQRKQPLQLIPVIQREAELPGFLATRQWVDFREEFYVRTEP